jgi:hypothetical protein
MAVKKAPAMSLGSPSRYSRTVTFSKPKAASSARSVASWS